MLVGFSTLGSGGGVDSEVGGDERGLIALPSIHFAESEMTCCRLRLCVRGGASILRSVVTSEELMRSSLEFTL
jgi:hypothetical protein